jgi:catechol 2,3-dioxygenase-like lactoylglutathione lyase family enzyme
VTGITKLSRIRLVAAQPEQLAEFYESAFGFVPTTSAPTAAASLAKLLGKPNATVRSLTLRLGEQEIELVGFHAVGRSFPTVAGWSPLFQHFAIVVADMAAAYARLRAQPGWDAISIGGPQVLPPTAGTVTAFKFRDLEGHPLEMLAFSPERTPEHWKRRRAGVAVGIDHSAISVADTGRSIVFYERFGLSRVGGSLNFGPAQEKLDDIPDVRVEVTALAPQSHPTPHVELLCYRGRYDRTGQSLAVNDVAATELVFAVDDDAALYAIAAENRDACLSGPVTCKDGPTRALFRDPDGHLLCLESVTGQTPARFQPRARLP